MKKVVVLIELMVFAMLFQNCKSSTEQEVAENTTIENVIKQDVDTLVATNNPETEEIISLAKDNDVPIVKNDEKSVVNANPKTVVTNTSEPKPKEVKTTVETPAPKVEVVTTPKEVVVVKEPEPTPKPDPVVTPVVVETPTTSTNEPHWVIPAKYKTMNNPMKNKGSEEGKDIWVRECKSCHGTKGLGDGPKAAKIDISCGDFSSKKFQSFSDGEIYYITSAGRKPMPSFKEKLTEDEIWLVVNYIRTLKK